MDWFNADNLHGWVQKYLHLIIFTVFTVVGLAVGYVYTRLNPPDPTVVSTNTPTEECSTAIWREVENVEFFGSAVTATSGKAKKQGSPPQWVAFKGAAQYASLWITFDNVRCVRFVGITERDPEVEFHQNANHQDLERFSGKRIAPQSNEVIVVPAGTRAMNISAPENGQTRITRIEVWP